jgi:hypothetical protein
MFEKDVAYKCYKCGEELEFDVKIGRRDVCPNCHAYLHCCFNCQFWNPGVHNQCTENRAEFIRDRAEGNFCLYFTFKKPDEDVAAEQAEAKAKLEAMFNRKPSAGPGPSPKTPDEAKARLDALFAKAKKR